MPLVTSSFRQDFVSKVTRLNYISLITFSPLWFADLLVVLHHDQFHDIPSSTFSPLSLFLLYPLELPRLSWKRGSVKFICIYCSLCQHLIHLIYIHTFLHLIVFIIHLFIQRILMSSWSCFSLDSFDFVVSCHSLLFPHLHPVSSRIKSERNITLETFLLFCH